MYHDQVLGEIDADTSNLVHDFPLLRWIASINHRGILLRHGMGKVLSNSERSSAETPDALQRFPFRLCTFFTRAYRAPLVLTERPSSHTSHRVVQRRR